MRRTAKGLSHRVLVAGATGHIGSHIVRTAHDAGYVVRALARDARRLQSIRDACDETFIGEATRADTLVGRCRDVDVVVSALGLRTLRARPTPELVDLRANLNILDRAREAGVRHFVFIAMPPGESTIHRPAIACMSIWVVTGGATALRRRAR